VHDMNS